MKTFSFDPRWCEDTTFFKITSSESQYHVQNQAQAWILWHDWQLFICKYPVDERCCLCHVSYSPDGDYTITSKWPAVWVKISSSWVCLLLYMWTLMAPMILTNRDFNWFLPWSESWTHTCNIRRKCVSDMPTALCFYILNRPFRSFFRNYSDMKERVSSIAFHKIAVVFIYRDWTIVRYLYLIKKHFHMNKGT